MMNIKMLFNLLLLLPVMAMQANSQKLGFNKPAFYAAMASDDLPGINEQLNILKGASVNEKEAYEGALMMKKAGLVAKAKEKLSIFKAGRLKLEAAIKRDPGNTEYYFLRLIIQEHAPKIVKYNNDLENDGSLIRSNFKNLSPVVQQAIIEYSKKSKILKKFQS